MSGNNSYDVLTAPLSEKQITIIYDTALPRTAHRTWKLATVIIPLIIGVAIASLGARDIYAWLTMFIITASILTAGVFLAWWSDITLARKRAITQYRYQSFAADNQMVYLGTVREPEYNGVIFDIGQSRQISDQFRSIGHDSFEVANYQYVISSGKSSTTYKHGYIRIKLKRRIAHMLLDSKSNNMNIFGKSFTNLPAAMSKDQVLSLEGNFNDYFTLYAPKQYERDALYIFTPDLMALLIDNTQHFDVEVIDDDLYVYGEAFNMLDEATWQKIFAIISTVGAKTITQTDYYADEKVNDRQQNIVAPQGSRLRRGIPWAVVLLAIVVVLGMLGQMILHAIMYAMSSV